MHNEYKKFHEMFIAYVDSWKSNSTMLVDVQSFRSSFITHSIIIHIYMKPSYLYRTHAYIIKNGFFSISPPSTNNREHFRFIYKLMNSLEIYRIFWFDNLMESQDNNGFAVVGRTTVGMS